MSDRVTSKVRLITVVKKTPRERMQCLVDCRTVENFTHDELRELYGKNSTLLLQTYQEFMAVADQEASSKGKLLTTVEACGVAQVLKDLMWFNMGKIAQNDWELAFWMKEVPCYLHQESHISVRRSGFEAMAMLIDIRAARGDAAATSATSLAIQEELQPLLYLLLSTLDWEYLRTVYGNYVSLPSTINEVRRGRHDCIPPRARYSTSQGGGADEREKDTVAMLRRIIVEPFLSKTATPSTLELWGSFLREHLTPLFMPAIAQRAGIVEGATLHGFLHGPHKKVHPVFVELIVLLGKRSTELQDRMTATLGATRVGTSLALWIAVEAVRDPCAEFAPWTARVLSFLSTVIKQSSSVSSTSAQVPLLPHAPHLLPDILLDVLRQNTIQLCPAFLLPAASEAALPNVAVFQSQVESYAEWFMVVASPNPSQFVLGTPTSHQSPADAPQPMVLTLTVRQLAVTRLGMLASELALLSGKKPSAVIDEVVPYVTQVFWAATIATIPLSSATFLELLSPVLHRVEEQLGPLLAATASPPYLIKCYAQVVLHTAKVFIAPSSGKMVPFSWPAAPVVQLSATAAAAASALLEYRLNRAPVPLDWISKALGVAMTSSPPQPQSSHDALDDDGAITSGGAPFVAFSETFHNALFHFASDSYPTQKLMAQTTVDAIHLFVEANKSGALVVEPDSLMKIFSPYLLLQSRLTEQVVPAIGRSSGTTASTSLLTMSQVAKDAVECLCEVIALASLERWGDAVFCRETPAAAASGFSTVEAANLYDDDNGSDSDQSTAPSAAAGHRPPPPFTPVLFVVALDRIREVLESVRTNKLDGDDIASRILVALFRGGTTSAQGKPSSCLFSNPQIAPFSLFNELRLTCLAVLEEPERPNSKPASLFLDAKTAALSGLVWVCSIDRRSEAPLDMTLEAALGSVVSMLRLGSKYPVTHLAKTIGYLIVQQLRRSASSCSESELVASVRVRVQHVVMSFVEILLANFNALDARVTLQVYGPVMSVVEALEDALKIDSQPAESRTFYLSREFFWLLYTRMITALCGAAMYHTYNWVQTRAAGESLLMLLHIITELSIRLGRLTQLTTFHVDSSKYRVLLIQLLADVVSLIQVGSTHKKYAVGIPQALRERCCTVSHVESAYQLMRENLEAQSAGITTSTADSTLVMIPPQDESARKWFGGKTPVVDSAAADTLLPQQVVQAGIELFESLLVHVDAFPHPPPHDRLEVSDTVVTAPPGVVERRYSYLVQDQQLITAEACELSPEVVYWQSLSMGQSCSWMVRPAHHAYLERPWSAPTSSTNPMAAVRRAPGLPGGELEELLDGYEGTSMPPKELLEFIAAPGVEELPGLRLDNGRSCDLPSLTAFTDAQPPTSTNAGAPLPVCDKNFVFSLLLSLGIVDVLELSKRQSSTSVSDGSTVTSLTPAAVATSEQRPPEHAVPVTAAAAASEVINDIPTRTLLSPLPCYIRSAAGLPRHASTALQAAHETVMTTFGVAADDVGLSYRFVGPRHEMIVKEVSSLAEAFQKSDALLCFTNTFAEAQRILREIRAMVSGRSFSCLFVLPNPVVSKAAIIHLARQGEAAPHLSPFVDGSSIALRTVGFHLRSALLSSASPWRQPVNVADAKRRVTQRATRLFHIKNFQKVSSLRASETPPAAATNASSSLENSAVPLAQGAATPNLSTKPPSSWQAQLDCMH